MNVCICIPHRKILSVCVLHSFYCYEKPPDPVRLARTEFYCKPNAACSFVWVAATGIFQMHNVVVMIMCLQSVKFQLEL